jgi:hypothetical protein
VASPNALEHPAAQFGEAGATPRTQPLGIAQCRLDATGVVVVEPVKRSDHEAASFIM